MIMSRVPDLVIREKTGAETVFAAAKWFALAGFGRGASRDFLKKRNRIRVSRFVSTGNVIEGNLSCLTYLFGRSRRPSPQCLRLHALLGKLHPTSSWLNRSLRVANQRCRLCSLGIEPTSTAGYFDSSAMRPLPRTS